MYVLGSQHIYIDKTYNSVTSVMQVEVMYVYIIMCSKNRKWALKLWMSGQVNDQSMSWELRGHTLTVKIYVCTAFLDFDS